MRSRSLVLVVALLAASGCGDRGSDTASASPYTTPPTSAPTSPSTPVASPTAVPAATGLVTTTQQVIVTDDGSGPRMCSSGISDLVGPPECDDYAVTGWDWEAVGGSEVQDGVRWGSYAVTGTFDGTTFAVEEATQPDPEPHVWDFEIPCPTPEGGWQVLDPSRSGQDDLAALQDVAEELDGYAMGAVSTPEGRPGPRDPAETVFSLYVAGDAGRAEAAAREVWGGMLCVTEVEHSHEELTKVQQALLDVPGWSEVGSGNTDNQVELQVFHDDGSIQQWADQEFGEGVVVVESILQPVG